MALSKGGELGLVVAVVAERVRYDNLRLRIDRRLCVIALDVTILGLEDAALGIGEVALRLWFRHCRRRRFVGPIAAVPMAHDMNLLRGVHHLDQDTFKQQTG
jgi:hypothetical protein